MDRAKPTANKLLTKKWQEKEMRIHINKVKNAVAFVEPVRLNKSVNIKYINNYRRDCKS